MPSAPVKRGVPNKLVTSKRRRAADDRALGAQEPMAWGEVASSLPFGQGVQSAKSGRGASQPLPIGLGGVGVVGPNADLIVNAAAAHEASLEAEALLSEE